MATSNEVLQIVHFQWWKYAEKSLFSNLRSFGNALTFSKISSKNIKLQIFVLAERYFPILEKQNISVIKNMYDLSYI